MAEELYRFTERLYRAETQHDVYEAALDIITRALGCRRASILLFDDAGIMRFAAWRDLSDGYRHALEGHSPWTRDVKDPQPVCIQDLEAANLPEFLKDTIKAEKIGALAFVPLVANNALIGKFMTYYGARHVFSDAELALSLTISRQLGFSLERRRAEEALRRTQWQLESELAAAKQLQQISTRMIHTSDVETLYENILDAAAAIMSSDFASMQMFYPERGALRLLAYRGFTPTAAASWEWVRPGSGTSCSAALATGCRSIVPDIELSNFIAGSKELEPLRQAGIRAMQSTPLVSRAGGLLGMISTHWRSAHEPSERDLRLLDVLARQAADLIERKQGALTNQRLAAIVDSSHDAVVSEGLDGLITTWNRGAERLFGYTSGEMIGRPITTLIAADRHHEEAEILQHIRRGGCVDPFETVRKHRDGSAVDVSVSVSPLKNAAGEVIGASSIARDITKRKEAELALAEREAQLGLAGKAARVGSFVVDYATRLIHISPGFAAIHGLAEETEELTCEEWRACVLPDDLERFEALRSQVIAERRRELTMEYRTVGADGEARWMESRGLVSYDADGRPTRLVGVHIDITERKRAEDQQRRLVAELDHRVKNVLATVQAVASHTMQASGSMEHFVTALDGRIRSMASTHELLSHRRWLGIPLAELVERELAPYTTGSNVEIGGPEVMLNAEAGQTMATVLHELVTNAAKYGALSVPSGRVSIRWRVPLNGSATDKLVLTWRETGGPLVVPPRKSSYGMQVVRELVPYELGGTVDHVLAPEGAQCQLEIPLAHVSGRTSQDNGSAQAGSSLHCDDAGTTRAV
ncbi:MAG TPA: PAS domain S-box protein [Hyphomicrobiaceae bacterium]|nr:PAS domain S-box protein [Hyphomicrobiaceae bacterium]